MANLKHGPGRPRKYGRPSRAVTVTLPEDVLARLDALDADLGRAIVMLAERNGRARVGRVRRAEISSYGKHAVIVVNPANALKRLPGVQLVPISNGRALISLDRPNSIAQLELDVRDATERTDLRPAERQTLEAIADLLRGARQSNTVSVVERTIIVIEAKRRRPTVGARPPRGGGPSPSSAR